jgi:hypothetical protein
MNLAYYVSLYQFYLLQSAFDGQEGEVIGTIQKKKYQVLVIENEQRGAM